MKPGSVLIVVAVVLTVLFLAFRTTSVDSAEAAATRAGLVADTLAASQDTTRVLALRVASLGDSLRVVERRAVQVDQKADALDHALGLDRAVRDSLAAAIASYAGTVRTDTVRDTVVVADTVRRGTFDIRQAPYTVHAQVDLAAPPEKGTMALGVVLDTVRLEVRVGCGPPGSGGVRAAVATVVGPSWAAVQLGRVEQSPDVCASLGVQESRWAPVKAMLGRIGVSAGWGAGVGAHNTLFAGPGVLVGIKLWP